MGLMPYRKIDLELASRHPFEIFVLCFALVVGLPALFGLAPRPQSFQDGVPAIIGVLWSLALVIGSLTALVGIFTKKRGLGLILEQLGLAFVGAACLGYSGVALAVVGLSALVPAGIIAGFAAACFAQYRRIQKILNRVYALEIVEKHERGRDE